MQPCATDFLTLSLFSFFGELENVLLLSFLSLVCWFGCWCWHDRRSSRLANKPCCNTTYVTLSEIKWKDVSMSDMLPRDICSSITCWVNSSFLQLDLLFGKIWLENGRHGVISMWFITLQFVKSLVLLIVVENVLFLNKRNSQKRATYTER